MSTAMESELSGTSVAVRSADAEPNGSIAAFASHEKFRAAQRIAQALAASSIVPKDYRGNVANCLVAMELASRTGASVLMVMQNLHLIQGRPSWSAAFLVASVNSSGRFSAIRYETKGGDDPNAQAFCCRAFAKDLATGDTLHGEWITWAMVKAEGWYGKDGSKWKTMSGQMFRYRAASFWVRVYAPEISLGMHTADEAQDIPATGAASNGTLALNAALVGALPASTEIVDQETGEVITPAAPKKPNPIATIPCEACGRLNEHAAECPYAD